MNNFSPEIILEILSRLPGAESVLTCKLVCKEWLDLIRSRSTYFVNMHIRNQLLQLGDSKHSDDIFSRSTNKFDLGYGVLLAISQKKGKLTKVDLYYGNSDNDKVRFSKFVRINHPPFFTEYDAVIGLCNGLVCMNGDNHQYVKEPVCILNPFTSEHVYLPRLKGEYHPHNLMRAGFGYLHSKDEYMVVRIFYADKTAPGHVQVYTLGDGNGWRDKGERIPYMLTPSSGVFANGAIHWVDLKNRQLVSFDLEDEVFQNLSLPKLSISQGVEDPVRLTVLGECLCLVEVVIVRKNMEDINVWSLRQKKNEEEMDHCSPTWAKEFTFASRDSGYHPFAMTRNSEVLFSHLRKIFSTYNHATKTPKCLVLRENIDARCCRVQAFLHRNSFVSLKDIGEQGTKTRNRISTQGDAKP